MTIVPTIKKPANWLEMRIYLLFLYDGKFVRYRLSTEVAVRVYKRGSEFSSYKIELRNRVTQIDVTLRATNLKMFTEILLSSY